MVTGMKKRGVIKELAQQKKGQTRQVMADMSAKTGM